MNQLSWVRAACAAIAATMPLIAASCSMGDHVETAKAGVDEFHARLAESKFEEIYADSASDFQDATTQEDAVKLFAAVITKLGKPISSSQSGWHVNFGTGGTVVTLEMQTEFERGKGVERYVFRISDGVARLMSYHINSNDLVVL